MIRGYPAAAMSTLRRVSVVLPLLTALLAAQTPPVEPVAVAARTGTCILAGGGKLPKEVIVRFVELAGGANARIVLIPTASQSADDPAEHEELKKLWREERGAEVSVMHTRDRAVADGEAFSAPLREATGVWFGGGTQKRIADAYLGTRVEKELMALLARGGVIGGTSAGTAIQTRTMIQEGKDPPIVAQGFDFVPGAISDQHFLKRERLPRLLKVLASHPGHVGIGVDESTAAVVCGGDVEVLGASKVVLVLPAHGGHEELVVELPAGSVESLDLWRRAARERDGWSIAAPGAPAVASGTLMIGRFEGDVARFVELAGGEAAKIVVVRHEPPHDGDALQRAGAKVIREVRLVHKATFGGNDVTEAFADATGVWLQDEHPYYSCEMLDRIDVAKMREAVAAVLARGGVVWGNAMLGEVIACHWPAVNDDPVTGYRRGLGVLAGTMIVSRRVGRARPGVGPTTDGAPHEWVYRCAPRMPRFTAIHVESAAIIRGNTLEVLGDLPTHVMPTREGTKPGDVRETIALEPGTRFDLTTGKKL